jgi:hypothetical protein
VPSTHCILCHASSRFNESSSSSFHSDFEPRALKYGKGEASGVLASESVTIAGAEVKAQPFILVTKDADMSGMSADGILGMAYPELSESKDTLVTSMFKQGIIEHPSFSVHIGNNDFGRKEEELESMVIFGGYDLKTYAKEEQFEILSLATVNTMEKTGYWSVRLTSISVGGSSVGLGSQFAILDTGTSLIIGPENEVNTVLEKITAHQKCITQQGLYVCPCSNLDTFPTIVFGLNGKNFYVNPQEYMMKDNGQCLVLISSMNFNAWILGDVFLRSYYTFYDMENAQRRPQIQFLNTHGLYGCWECSSLCLLWLLLVFTLDIAA